MTRPGKPFRVRQAGLEDVDAIAPLFDSYRQFYEQPPDRGWATDFIRERLSRSESIILLATSTEDQALGFCQIYPSFCSVLALPIGVLYDLFIDPSARQSGAGRALMQAAEQFAQTAGWARLDLTTAKSNIQAQSLYESQGWVRDTLFYAYSKELEPQR